MFKAENRKLEKSIIQNGVRYYQIDFTRKVFDLWKHYKAYRQVKQLAEKNKYIFLHCHSPIGGVIGRLVGHRVGIKSDLYCTWISFFKERH